MTFPQPTSNGDPELMLNQPGLTFEASEDWKEDGYTSTEVDAEQWLTRRSPTAIPDSIEGQDEKENGVLLVRDEPLNPALDPEAGNWLTRGNRDLLMEWRRHTESLDDKEKLAPSVTARSSFSSPGKSSLREKLQHRLLKRQLNIERKESQAKAETRMDQDDSMEYILGDNSHETMLTSPMSDSGMSTPSRHEVDNTVSEESCNTSLCRLSRTVRYGRRGELPLPHRRANIIRLHIYDLLANDTVMELPFGCDFPIGRCFQVVNNGLHALGTGVYHTGIEVNGIEYAYGANEIAGCTGVFTCVPKHSPGYQHRASIDFGSRVVRRTSWVNVQTDLVNIRTGKTKVSDVYHEVEDYLDGREIMKQMASEYHGLDYDLLRKNCCTFAFDACRRLGIDEDEIPTWFMNLADAGAQTSDTAEKTMAAIFQQPEKTMRPRQRNHEPRQHAEMQTGGFEIVAEKGLSDKIQNVKVIEATEQGVEQKQPKSYGVRRTLSWTY